MVDITPFADRLKLIREETHLTQDAFSKELGYSRMAYAYYEAGKRTPDIKFLGALHEYTGYTYDYLMGASEAKKPENVDLSSATGLNDAALEVISDAKDELNMLSEELTSDAVVSLLDVFVLHMSGALYTAIAKSKTISAASAAFNQCQLFENTFVVNALYDCKCLGYERLTEEDRESLRAICDGALDGTVSLLDELFRLGKFQPLINKVPPQMVNEFRGLDEWYNATHGPKNKKNPPQI